MLFGDQGVWLPILDAFYTNHEVIRPSIHVFSFGNYNPQMFYHFRGHFYFSFITECLLFLPIVVDTGAIFWCERLVLLVELFKVLQVEA